MLRYFQTSRYLTFVTKKNDELYFPLNFAEYALFFHTTKAEQKYLKLFGEFTTMSRITTYEHKKIAT